MHPKDYSPRADGTPLSRWQTPVNYVGNAAHENDSLTTAVSVLVSEIEAECREIPAEEAQVRLFAVVATEQPKGYLLRERGVVTGPRRFTPDNTKRPNRFAKTADNAGADIDAFFLGESKLSEQQVWQKLLELARLSRWNGEQCRAMSNAVAKVMIVRAGLAPVRADALPMDHLRSLTPSEMLRIEAEQHSAPEDTGPSSYESGDPEGWVEPAPVEATV